MSGPPSLHSRVAESLARSPIIGVVRTASLDAAREQARLLAAAGVELIEITFTVPGGSSLVRELLADRLERSEGSAAGPPWYGMGTVTGGARAAEAVAAGAEFLVSPNVDAEVARAARQADLFLVLGALTPTEIVAAFHLGSDVVKVYPLPPVGGPGYLTVIRGPLGDVPMLAAGGFGVEEIAQYRAAGAQAFGMAAPLLGTGEGEAETRSRVARAFALARSRPA